MSEKKNKRTSRQERDPIYNLEKELKEKGFSKKTVESYLHYVEELFNYANKSPKDVCSEDIRDYLISLREKGLSNSTINVAINAIKFYYTRIIKRNFFISKEIKRVKKDKKLPDILSKNEVRAVLRSIENKKHELMLGLMYSSGLRVSEVVSIKVEDFDFQNGILSIKNIKGAEDRDVVLAEKAAKILEEYTKDKSREDYVFDSRWGRKMTERMVQKVFAKALKKSGIKRQASCQTLRHSFAIHLLEAGADIKYIKELLGHKRIETTCIYEEIIRRRSKKFISPFD